MSFLATNDIKYEIISTSWTLYYEHLNEKLNLPKCEVVPSISVCSLCSSIWCKIYYWRLVLIMDKCIPNWHWCNKNRHTFPKFWHFHWIQSLVVCDLQTKSTWHSQQKPTSRACKILLDLKKTKITINCQTNNLAISINRIY